MAHAKLSDLKDLKNLLDNLRTISALKEKSVGCFYLKSKGVLHFHIKDSRRYAHVFDGKNWQELDIEPQPSESRQKRLFKELSAVLPL